MIKWNGTRPRGTGRDRGLFLGVRNGFTLIEILIVVVILGILSAVIVPQFSGATEDADETAAHSQLNVLRGQVTLYFAKHGTVAPLGDDVPTVVRALSQEGLLSSVPSDIDQSASGFQVPAGYTLVWDPDIWALDAIGSDGSASGW